MRKILWATQRIIISKISTKYWCNGLVCKRIYLHILLGFVKSNWAWNTVLSFVRGTEKKYLTLKVISANPGPFLESKERKIDFLYHLSRTNRTRFKIVFQLDLHSVLAFLAARAAIYLHMGLTEWVTFHHSEGSLRQCARIRSDNLQRPYASKLEVIWDQTTSNFLVYNLQLPRITSNFMMVVKVIMVVILVMLVMVVVVVMSWTGQSGQRNRGD